MNDCRGASQKWVRSLCAVCLYISQLIILLLIVSDPPVMVWRWKDPWSWLMVAILTIVIVSIDTMILSVVKMLLGIVRRNRSMDIFTVFSGVLGVLGLILYMIQLFESSFLNTAFYVIIPLFTLLIWVCWICQSYRTKKRQTQKY